METQMKSVLTAALLFVGAALLSATAQDRIRTDFGDTLEVAVTKIGNKSISFSRDGNDAVIPVNRVTGIEFSDGGRFVFGEGAPTIVRPGHFETRFTTLLAEGLLPVTDNEFWKWADKDTHGARLNAGRAAARYGSWGIRIGAAGTVTGAFLAEKLTSVQETLAIDVKDQDGLLNTVTVTTRKNYSLAGYTLLFSGLGVLLDGIGWDIAGARTIRRVAEKADYSARGEEQAALRQDLAAEARRDKRIGIGAIAGGTALLGTGIALFEKNNRQTCITVRQNAIVYQDEGGEWRSVVPGNSLQQEKATAHWIGVPFMLVGAAVLHAGIGALHISASMGPVPDGYGLTWRF